MKLEAKVVIEQEEHTLEVTKEGHVVNSTGRPIPEGTQILLRWIPDRDPEGHGETVIVRIPRSVMIESNTGSQESSAEIRRRLGKGGIDISLPFACEKDPETEDWVYTQKAKAKHGFQ